MTFDLGGFTSGIIGTLGALGAVYLTFLQQDKRNKPTINKGRTRVVVNAFIIMTEARNKILYASHEENPLNEIAAEAISLQDKLCLLQPDAIECDPRLYDHLDDMCSDIQDMLSNYGEQSIRNIQSTDVELAEEFKEVFKEFTHKHARYFGELKQYIRNAAG